MNPRLILFTACFIASMSFSATPNHPSYPVTRKDDVIDDYHGIKVPDPYRWLEDDNSEETKAWVKAQNVVTAQYLQSIPQRAGIRDRLTKLWNYERYGIPLHRGAYYFYSYNTGLQNQPVLEVMDSLSGSPRILIDPNTLSTDGTTSLTVHVPSEDGTLLAYGLSKAGSDWEELHVRDVATGKDRPDLLRWVKFSGASWAKDGSGFYYNRYEEPKDGAALTQKNENQRVCFHKLSTSQAEDVTIYERPDHPDWLFDITVSDDGHYLVISAGRGTDPKHRIFYKDIAQPNAPVTALLPNADASYEFIDNIGSVFYFHTDLHAQRFRVVAIDVMQPDAAHWREIIPPGKDKLQNVSLVGDQFICEYLHDARSLVRCFTLDGKPVREIALPGIGSTGGFYGRRTDAETFYSFTGFTEPGIIFRLDLPTGVSNVWRQTKTAFDPSPYETKQVFVTSRDGTHVPMFLVHKRGLKLDGQNPTLLYGYGGFNISLTPGFSVSRAVWLEMGGVYAMANLRGGGEYGSEWHLAGTKENKQNVFNDFIACAEWLIAEHYTSTPKLAIQGGSNGGLLVGACMTQRPDLYGAALPAVGVMDMLRFHKFTIGWAWTSDYGSADDKAMFPWLRAYSPLHNLKPGTRYPATLITTADHDDRVVPAHSFKFAARLQECQTPDGPPVLIRIETSAGHGAGTALSKTIESSADQWAFLVKELGMEDKLGKGAR